MVKTKAVIHAPVETNEKILRPIFVLGMVFG